MTPSAGPARVFVIPSWYPSVASPISGLFVREQVDALAALCPQWQAVVSLWGHHDCTLSLQDWPANARALRWWATHGASVQQRGAVSELMQPALSWTLALAGGGVRGQLASCRRNLQRARAQGEVALMHAHVSFPAGFIAARLSQETGIPYVLTEHMGPFPFVALRGRNGQPKAALREAFAGAKRVLAVSEALAEGIRAQGLRVDAVVPNAVDERRFVLSAAPSQPSPHTTPRVIFSLCSMVAGKGVDVLLRAFAQWNPAPGSAELRLGGAGPLLAAHQQLARELGVADRVRWLGALAPEQVPEQMAACHFFALASRHETFGVVLVEALMAGKPVLATRCGGPEGIVHPGNGRLVAVGDVAALAEGLAWLAAHGSAFDARTLRDDAICRFGRAAVVGQLEQVYADVCAGGPAHKASPQVRA
jgi:glycosyltransferase involved in cell wall biosynthesis